MAYNCCKLVGLLVVCGSIYIDYLANKSAQTGQTVVAKVIEESINLNKMNPIELHPDQAVYLVDKLKLSENSDSPYDPLFEVDYNGFVLRKEIEMYLWVQTIKLKGWKKKWDDPLEEIKDAELFAYHKQWKSNKMSFDSIDSKDFLTKEGHQNPENINTLFNENDPNEYYSSKCMLGQYRIHEVDVKKCFSKLPKEIFEDITEVIYNKHFYSVIYNKWKYKDGHISDGDLNNPKIGDIRIRFSGLNLGGVTATFFGSVSNNMLTRHTSTDGDYFFYLALGNNSLQQVSAELNQKNSHKYIGQAYSVGSFFLICCGCFLLCIGTRSMSQACAVGPVSYAISYVFVWLTGTGWSYYVVMGLILMVTQDPNFEL